MKNFISTILSRFAFPIAIGLGLLTGVMGMSGGMVAAETVSGLFVSLLKLVSLPIIFLSIISTASGMDSMEEIKSLGKRVLKYTLLTTLIAAAVALGLFLMVDPAKAVLAEEGSAVMVEQPGSYLSYLLQAVPSNIVQPFATGNVIGVLFLAMILSLAILALPTDQRRFLHSFFSSLYSAMMKITSWIIRLLPIAIWAFVALFVRDLSRGMEIHRIALYLFCVVAANVIQAVVVLPLFLKGYNVSPLKMFKAMFPALSVAFFSKSSSAALPTALRCAEERAGVSRKVAGFSMPLCTTINMNACAAFILITVLFVSMSHGYSYSGAELLSWIFIATVAAIGNAGVPMGCYFLASAFLASMNVPLHILGIILPFYSLIDMFESAVNVWSDSCVTAVVSAEVEAEEKISAICVT